MPWFVPRAGDTIEWSAPVAGEQGVLLCPGGDTIGAVFLRGVYSDAFPAPASEAAKHLVRIPDGAMVEYDHGAHALKATLPGGGTAEITADGGVTINGPLTVNGETHFNGNTQTNGDAGVSGRYRGDDEIGGGKSLKGHGHTGVAAGGAYRGHRSEGHERPHRARAERRRTPAPVDRRHPPRPSVRASMRRDYGSLLPELIDQPFNGATA